MTAIACPHCQSSNPGENTFCESCGKALPRNSGGPRVVGGEAMPQSAAGQVLVGDELKKQMKKVFTTLLVVGILQVVVGGVLAAVASSRFSNSQVQLIMVVQFIVAGLFLGLAFWSRKAPLPASVVGLVLYCTLVILNVINSVSQIGNGQAGRGLGGIGIGWLDIVVIAVLAQGIQAAIKYKKLQQSGN
jgi:hypothetical protein